MARVTPNCSCSSIVRRAFSAAREDGAASSPHPAFSLLSPARWCISHPDAVTNDGLSSLRKGGASSLRGVGSELSGRGELELEEAAHITSFSAM